jgi:FKBP-type peptidyl-prolyl cis-trans isomerase FklB
MKWMLSHALILAGLAAFSAAAQQTGPPPQTPKAPGMEKLSYALGMNLGLQLKRSGVAPDPKIVAMAIRDVLDGKPAEIQPDEIRSILKQAEAAGHFKLSSKNIAEGEAFLVKNAGADGITTLPDGLQYRVLKTGPGELPKKAQILTLSFRGH